MQSIKQKLIQGYKQFLDQQHPYSDSKMQELGAKGQSPEVMVVCCCDSRVDPSILLQTKPGDIFVIRNVANLVPPFENDEYHHGTSAALEYGICYLKIKKLIIMGHSQCGGIGASLQPEKLHQNDFIGRWTDQIRVPEDKAIQQDEMAKLSLLQSYENCLSFPWIKQALDENKLSIDLWFFDIQNGQLVEYDQQQKSFVLIED